MARDFQRMVRPSGGVFLPPWALGFAGFLLLLFLGFAILREPVLGLQVVSTPDGTVKVRVERRRHSRDYFRVQVRDGLFWHTVYSTPTVTTDLSEDLGARLRWNPDHGAIEFEMQGRVLWTLEHGLR